MAIKVANNQSLTAITSIPASITGTGSAMTLLETQTASSDATISFTDNIDDTYDEYVFKFYNIHPATDGAYLTFQSDTGTNTSYNQTVTSTFIYSQNDEADSDTDLAYATSRDQANGTAFQPISLGIDADNDSSFSGTLQIFAPSSSTYTKQWISVGNEVGNGYYNYHTHAGGWFDTATPLTRFQFKMSSDEIDAGVIKLYGIS
jgi:hypothetical protein